VLGDPKNKSVLEVYNGSVVTEEQSIPTNLAVYMTRANVYMWGTLARAQPESLRYLST
jgi:hypothetical protein